MDTQSAIYILIGITGVTLLLLIISLFRKGADLKAEISDLVSENEKFRSAIEARFDVMRSENNSQLTAMLSRSDKLSETLSNNLENLRKDNAEQLERMRHTVDEQLHQTLETRLTQSFSEVSKQLEAVYKGLGEMQTLAKSVGDLSRIFSNVKSRGTWGEVQAQSILDDILTRDQYVVNFHPRAGSGEVVEFAIKLPGRDDEAVFLPIDSKFPREDYEKYLDAVDEGDGEKARFYRKEIQKRVKEEAKDIMEKYINPPLTTDFALLFLPSESLYAEVLSIPGLSERLQSEYRVTIAGPTTLSALVNSLQMGFRTLQVEKRSHEVWKLFSEMRKQFSLFSTSLAAAEKSVEAAAGKLGDVSKRSERLTRRLNGIQLPDSSYDENA